MEKETDISLFGMYFPGIFQLGPLIQIPEMLSGTKLVNPHMPHHFFVWDVARPWFQLVAPWVFSARI